jgi:hypothetical protein
MIRCSQHAPLEGVPKVVQKVKFDRALFSFHFTLFNDTEHFMDANQVQGMRRSTRTASDAQYANAETIFLRHYDGDT